MTEDSDRLDWLERTSREIDIIIRFAPDFDHLRGKRLEIVVGREPLVPGVTLREAIDSAMKVIL